MSLPFKIHTLEDADVPKYEGSRIRNVRIPNSLDEKIDSFLERTGREFGPVTRQAWTEFLDKYDRDKVTRPKK